MDKNAKIFVTGHRGMVGSALVRRMAQGRIERLNRASREGNLRQDRRLAQVLSFSGRGE